jgi:hypothetical protein
VVAEEDPKPSSSPLSMELCVSFSEEKDAPSFEEHQKETDEEGPPDSSVCDPQEDAGSCDKNEKEPDLPPTTCIENDIYPELVEKESTALACSQEPPSVSTTTTTTDNRETVVKEKESASAAEETKPPSTESAQEKDSCTEEAEKALSTIEK